MEQLSGLDAAFVHQDSQRTPMHICAVLVYDTGDSNQWALSLADLKRLAADRLAPFPLFHRKLQQVPMGMDTPYWIDVATPAWGRHIKEISLAPGSTWAALQDVLARLHGTRMNLKQPLWEMHLIQGLQQLPGLPRHCQALVLKIHHSAIDGISMAVIIDALHRDAAASPAQSRTVTEAPEHWRLWARVNVNNFGRQIKLAETVGNLVPGFLRARQTRQQFEDLPPVARSGCRFNAPVSRGRSTGTVLLPVAQVLAVKRAVRRVTLNDIAMACVAGALRQYLQRHGQLPVKSLTSGIPINLRTADETPAGGNKIATMVVGLATHIADPVERLRMVHRYAVAGKKQINALGTGTVMDISDSLTPSVLAEGIRTMAWASRMAELPVPFHTMISNVPGPQVPLFLGRAELVVPIGLGPVRDNMALFHIVSNSQSMVSLSFAACKKRLPDAQFYQECLQNAFRELYAQALGKEIP